MANETIMIVDDDVNICKLLRLYLEKEKYETSKRFLNDYMLYLLSKKFPIIL